MEKRFSSKKVNLRDVVLFSLPLLLFWVILLIKTPYSFSNYLSTYTSSSFLIVLALYYLCYRLPDRYSVFAGLCLSMILFAVALSYKWTSGYSDNMIIGGLLPYKDAKNYYTGANLILNGLPMVNAGQATERPLFPGFLSSLLLLTGQNLKIVTAMITQLAAIGLYLSARQIRNSLGILPASLYLTLMYFYIQPLIGYTLSELLGFILGCFAFCLLWVASYNLKWSDLILGLLTLLMAVSARAGAFFIFPALIVWIGWVFRGEKRFSMKAATYAFGITFVGFFLPNRIYAQLLGIPPGLAFGNFSYALYGQVRGGTGWHSAIEELGTRNSAAVYQAALQYFLKHPIGLVIGVAKSFRDFFLLGDGSIFPFKFYGWQNWFDVVMWAGTMILLIWGLVRIFKNIRTSNSSLIIAGIAGVLLSIPFLPPIDGGARFYASTMPFFFILPAIGIEWFSRKSNQNSISKDELQKEMLIPRFGSATLIVCTLIVPVAIFAFGQKQVYTTPSCPTQQIPFAIETHSGSYIDLIKGGNAQCGFVPEVCLSDFEKNNSEKLTDDYYQVLISLANTVDANVRIIPANDLIQEKFHYFFISEEKFPIDSSSNLMSGCAIEFKTQNQSIYYVESVVSNLK